MKQRKMCAVGSRGVVCIFGHMGSNKELKLLRKRIQRTGHGNYFGLRHFSLTGLDEW